MCLYALCVIGRVELCALLLNLMRLSGLFVLWCVVVSGVRVCEFVCVLVCCLCGLFCCA